MTQQEINTKIAELDIWLTENPTHNDLSQVLIMKREYENQLKEHESF
ncbi:hypothetical protein [Flavobacterium sp.]